MCPLYNVQPVKEMCETANGLYSDGPRLDTRAYVLRTTIYGSHVVVGQWIEGSPANS
jgi:hypothetical protein